jgi:ankyrin repeat protein
VQYRANLDAQEPFEGNTALHTLAREGFAQVAARLLEAGATHTLANFAGRTPVQEAHEELRRMERHSNGTASATRRAKLRETIDTLTIVIAAID